MLSSFNFHRILSTFSRLNKPFTLWRNLVTSFFMCYAEDFSLGELVIVRQQLENEEHERAKFIEKMLENFAQDHEHFMERFDEIDDDPDHLLFDEEDCDAIDCF